MFRSTDLPVDFTLVVFAGNGLQSTRIHALYLMEFISRHEVKKMKKDVDMSLIYDKSNHYYY